jgi:RsiW-degrading membrane proteinase PrsW (M82 family)
MLYGWHAQEPHDCPIIRLSDPTRPWLLDPVSIYAMTALDVAARERPPQIVPEVHDATQGTGRAAGPPGSPLADATQAIITHIPTEIVTAYVALTALVNQPSEPIGAGQWVAMWVGLALTPMIVWLLYAGRLKTDGKPLPLNPKQWPWTTMVVSSVAFMVWAFSLPRSPFESMSWSHPAVSAAVLLIGTTLIGLTANLLRRSGP